MQQSAKRFISPQEYFEMEEIAEYKNEYYQGEIFAMSGASFNHNLIASNILISIGNALQSSDCFVLSSDMKVEIDRDSHYTYPDVSVVCGEIGFAGNRNDVITNPLVIIEILSESTMDYDRGSKFTAYRNIPSLKDYILIDQYACHVEHFYQNDTGSWELEEFKSLHDRFKIRSINIELYLNIVYHRVRIKKT